MKDLLRSYNQIALAVILTWVLILLGVLSFYWWRAERDLADDSYGTKSIDLPVSGEEFETTGGTITVYSTEVPNDFEAVRDVRYVAMATGKVTMLTSDPKTLVYGEREVGKLGRVALVKTGTRNGRPVFDFVFVSFPSLNRFIVARSIDSLDTVQQLDDIEFSAIIWDSLTTARFVIVDTTTGAITATRQLDFSGSKRSSNDSPSSNYGAEADAVSEEPRTVFK